MGWVIGPIIIAQHLNMDWNRDLLCLCDIQNQWQVRLALILCYILGGGEIYKNSFHLSSWQGWYGEITRKNPRIMKISSEDDKSNGGDAYDDVSDTIHEDDDSKYYLSP